ncbi:hypothetical protein HK405_011864, partial [Cladochytrium tenue]
MIGAPKSSCETTVWASPVSAVAAVLAALDAARADAAAIKGVLALYHCSGGGVRRSAGANNVNNDEDDDDDGDDECGPGLGACAEPDSDDAAILAAARESVRDARRVRRRMRYNTAPAPPAQLHPPTTPPPPPADPQLVGTVARRAFCLPRRARGGRRGSASGASGATSRRSFNHAAEISSRSPPPRRGAVESCCEAEVGGLAPAAAVGEAEGYVGERGSQTARGAQAESQAAHDDNETEKAYTPPQKAGTSLRRRLSASITRLLWGGGGGGGNARQDAAPAAGGEVGHPAADE